MNHYTFVLPSENQNAICANAVYNVIQSLKDISSRELSPFGGYIYSIGLVEAVSESLQELARSSSSSMQVTLNYE